MEVKISLKNIFCTLYTTALRKSVNVFEIKLYHVSTTLTIKCVARGLNDVQANYDRSVCGMRTALKLSETGKS